MRGQTLALVALAAHLALPLRAEVALPSGLEAALLEGFVELQPDGARWGRFRYVMPALAEGADFDAVQQDFSALCEGQALPMLEAAGEAVALVVVSLMDKPMEFGQSDPGTVQYFESFAIRDGRCIWEEF
ncbi:MAG: DUF6497 family protein [Paracoccaceae bacterium]